MNKGVSYLGLNSLFGRVTTNLLKQSPCIQKLSLYDDDCTILENEANVFIGRDQLPDAVKDVNIVVIGDEPCDTHGEKKLKIIGPKIIRYTEAILKSSPNAIIVVAASPLNVLVPLVGHFLGPDWQHRLLGITSVDTLRASRILNGLLNNPLGQAHILPVVGGSSATSRVPLFSHLHPKTAICEDIREKILEKMKLFDNSEYREMDSVERAYSAVRFIHSLISGMLKDSPVPEIAMTKTTEVPNAEFFSLPMLIGKNGIENAMPLPKFDETEEKLFLEATVRLAEDSRKARDFINSLAQESVRNANTSCNVSDGKSLAYKKFQLSDDPPSLLTDNEITVKGVEEITSSPKVASPVCKSSKLNNVINTENNSAQAINDPSGRESGSFTYRLLARPCDSTKEFHETQTISRKCIPKCPTYQLVPESKEMVRDSRRVVGDDETKINVNKIVGSTKRTTTLGTAEDISSKGSKKWQSPTRTALETSNRTEVFKERDAPQPANIQNLVAEVIQLESVSKTDSHSRNQNSSYNQNQNKIERRPSLTESDVSVNDGMGGDCTETLLAGVTDHLRALGSVDGHKNEMVRGESNHLGEDDKFMPYKTGDSDTKQDIGSDLKQKIVSSNNNDIAFMNSCHDHSKPKEDSPVLSGPQCSNNSQKVFQNELVSNDESAPDLNSNRMITIKKCYPEERRPLTADSEFLSGMKKSARSTNDECVTVDDIKKYQPAGENPISPSSKNAAELFSAQNCLHEKCKLEVSTPATNQCSEETIRKKWKKKLSDENMWASSIDSFAFANRQKNVSNESNVVSVGGKKKPQSKPPVRNEQRPNQHTKNSYPIGFPCNRHMSKKSAAAKTVASEERVLCLSNGRIDSEPKKQGNKEWLIPEDPSSKSTNRPERDVGMSEMLLRSKRKAVTYNSNRGMSFPSGANANSKIVKDTKWSKNGEDLVFSKLAAKNEETDSCELIKDMKRELHALGQCHSSPSDTPLKLLNFPGCKHRYETSLKILEAEEKKKDVDADAGDSLLAVTRNDLTSGKTKDYFVSQRRSSVCSNRNTYDSPLSLEVSKKKRSGKRVSKQKETQKRSSNKMVSPMLASTSKKATRDRKKQNGKHATPVVNQCATSKKMEHQRVTKNTSTRNISNRKKSEQTGVTTKKYSDLTKEDEWESKYFTKASEMFFRMFRDSVAENNVSLERGKDKTRVDLNDGTHAKNEVQEDSRWLPEVLSIQPTNISSKNDAPSRVEAVEVNRAFPRKNLIGGNAAGNFTKPDGMIEKSDSYRLPPTTSETKKAKTPKPSVDIDEKLRTKQKISYGITSLKIAEGPIVKKLLQSPGGKIEKEAPVEEKKEVENSVFNTKITGMEKYQTEKNDNMKKEISLNPPIDVEKLFEESSTIPLHSSSESAGKMWLPKVGVIEKETKPGFVNHQPILQGINATSDKGRGDAVNMIDFSICKSPFINDQGPLKNAVGKTRVDSSLEKCSSNGQFSQLLPASKSCCSIKNDNNNWRTPVVSVPISSKNIKLVNPQNYKEQILNYSARKTDDEIPRTEKTNKWERILTIFKQIIIRDLEDEKPDLARNIESAKMIKKPATQLRNAEPKVSHSLLKLNIGGNPVLNQKILKGKKSSKVKKKTEIVKKKLPAEVIRRNKVVKNNPKKIVNYFSKRGQASSAYEKASLTNFTVNSFEQAPGFLSGSSVDVEKQLKTSMSIPSKIK